MAEEERNEQPESNLFDGFDLTGDMSEISEFFESKQTETNEEQSSTEETNQEETIPPIDNEEGINNDDNEAPSSEDTPENLSSLYTAIANVLKEDGLLQIPEDMEIKDSENLISIFKKNFEESINQYKESFDPRVRWLQDNLEQGIPFEQLLQLDKDNITYNSIDETDLETNTELQRNIVKDYYKRSTKFSDERIEKELNRLDDISELKDEAKSSLTELKKLLQVEEQEAVANAQATRNAQLQAQAQALDSFKKQLEQTNEVIPGIPLNNIMRDKIYKTMTTPVAQDQFGNPVNNIGKHRMENPLDFEFKLAAVYEYTKGFTDFSVFNAPAKKSAIKELELSAHKLDLQKNTGNLNTGRISKETVKTILDAMPD